jgi:penicillin-binding protein 1A
MSVTPHAILEVRTGAGDVVWRYDRDGPKPRRTLPEKVTLDMIYMMNKVAEEGTGRRALIDGVRIAGKTGTTNNYRDGWFVGYSGNFVAGVWVGNDDYSSTNRMTGGSLPAMIWHVPMAYAHQGIEIKPLPGIPPFGPVVAKNEPVSKDKSMPAPPVRPTVLTRRGTDVLVRIERMMEDASKTLPAPSGEVSELPPGPRAGASRPEALASANGDSAAATVRGN